MRVIRAEILGMCFGVRDALEVIEGISDPGGLTILGQLVHNEIVLDELRTRGFAMASRVVGLSPVRSLARRHSCADHGTRHQRPAAVGTDIGRQGAD